jgi:GxxExxY protein
MEMNELTKLVIGASIEVHKHLGPGLLESVYQECLVKELRSMNILCKENVPVKVVYKGEELEKVFYVDVLVENCLIIELKAIEYVLPVHKSQLLTYLKLSNIKTGLLINFNVSVLKDGLSRLAN